jgi:hypothetical protein
MELQAHSSILGELVTQAIGGLMHDGFVFTGCYSTSLICTVEALVGEEAEVIR